jgi:hypothetical protein
MADIVQSLFGITPEMYQQSQQARADAQALQYAQLTPFQQANYAISRGANMLAGAIGRGLGGEDPELARITMRQQIAGQLDPNNPESFNRGIEMLRQSGDGQGAFMLQMEADKYKQQAQERQLSTLKTEDYLTQRGQGMQAAGLTNMANDLVGQLKNPDGTINEEVKAKLLSFPQGRAAISEQAKVLPSLRQLGASGIPEVNPFDLFVNDPNIPQSLKITAKQYQSSFAKGIYDTEQADKLVERLSTATQKATEFQQTQDRLKQNQEQLEAFKQQGLANSTASLNLQRQQFELSNALKSQKLERDAEIAKNKPLPSYLAKDEEADYGTATAATNLASDANNFINRIKSGEIKFGLKDKASIRARQLVGSQDPDVLAREDYDKFLKVLTNESLRLNKGTQTEGDAVRAAKELESSESPQAAAAAMKRLVEINVRRTQNASDDVLRRRKNANFPEPVRPIDVPKFDVQIIDNAEYQRFLKNPKFPSGTAFIDPEGQRRTKP